MFKGLFTRRAAALVTAVAGLGTAMAIPAAPAHAAPSAGCAADADLSQPFAAWGDTNEYRLLPGGDFTGSATGWTLAGGAAVVAGGDPFGLTPASDTGSLSLPAGASAVSPPSCVDSSQPSFRFLDTAAPGSTVMVAVVYASSLGPVTLPVGRLTPGGGWQPSPAYGDGAAIAGLLNGGTAQMSVKLTATSGSSQIDDVFVDPRMGWG
jgi:hypothetical protein